MFKIQQSTELSFSGSQALNSRKIFLIIGKIQVI